MSIHSISEPKLGSQQEQDGAAKRTELIRAAVTLVAQGMETIADCMNAIDALSFPDIKDEFVLLEQAMSHKAFSDAAFAYLADKSDAGRVVGSTRPMDFLTKVMGLSRKEAMNRLQRGKDLFEPPAAPIPKPCPDNASTPDPEESPQQRRAREKKEAEEAKQRAREEAEEQERQKEAQQRARDAARAQAASEEKQRIIHNLLRDLDEEAKPGSKEMLELALIEARKRSPEDLQLWLRERIKKANKAAIKARNHRRRLAGDDAGPSGSPSPDPYAGYRKRAFWIGQPDEEGMVRFGGKAPAYLAAALKAALADGLRPGVNLSEKDAQGAPTTAKTTPQDATPTVTRGAARIDTRSRNQRGADQLLKILQHYLSTNSQVAKRQGVGSIVISMTAADVNTMSTDSEFLSNTGDLLTPFDILQLGAAQYDVGVVHDEQGKPLNLARLSRSASLFQKIALMAMEGVCSCGECDVGLAFAHIHHIDPWENNGPTDLDNLTMLCPWHHGDNNDAHNGAGGMGHMERCPETGRAGKRPADGGPLQFNNSTLQEHSAGAKIRRARDTRQPQSSQGTTVKQETLSFNSEWVS